METDGGTLDGRSLLWGADDRVRATWRVLLAFPVLWLLTGGVLTGNLLGLLELSGLANGFAQSALHALFFLGALWVWATVLEHASLGEYGVSATPRWAVDCLVGYGAFVAAILLWAGLGEATGTATVTASVPSESFAVIGITVVMIGLHAAVQQVVFFRVILGSALEGLRARAVSRPVALVTALAVAAVIFILMHGLSTPARVLDLAIAGTCFGLLYSHTDDLALGIGVQTGALLSGGPLLAGVTIEQSFPGLLGAAHQYGFPKVVVAYGLLLGWLWWRRTSSEGDWFEGVPGGTRSA